MEKEFCWCNNKIRHGSEGGGVVRWVVSHGGSQTTHDGSISKMLVCGMCGIYACDNYSDDMTFRTIYQYRLPCHFILLRNNTRHTAKHIKMIVAQFNASIKNFDKTHKCRCVCLQDILISVGLRSKTVQFMSPPLLAYAFACNRDREVK